MQAERLCVFAATSESRVKICVQSHPGSFLLYWQFYIVKSISNSGNSNKRFDPYLKTNKIIINS